MSTTSSGVGKAGLGAAGVGVKEKHPVGYLKEHPGRPVRVGCADGVFVCVLVVFSARHDLAAHTARGRCEALFGVWWVAVGCGLVVG